jgi:HEPN domain-containing protein
MKPATREWVGKAEDDYAAAVELQRSAKRLHDQVCFHCQQSAEKYLKALLEELSQPIPKTHDLELLFGLLLPAHLILRSCKRGLLFLVDFAVDARYPGSHATKRQSSSAIRWASQVRAVCRALLGMRSPGGSKGA